MKSYILNTLSLSLYIYIYIYIYKSLKKCVSKLYIYIDLKWYFIYKYKFDVNRKKIRNNFSHPNLFLQFSVYVYQK
jgi:hypothetical protein